MRISIPKPAIKKNAEAARDWEYSEEAEYLYGMANLFKDRFLDPILLTDRGRLPDPVISFSDKRNRKVLASYTLHRNPQGLLDEITFNTVHYQDEDGKKVWAYGKWAQLETLLHEQVHLWQQNFGRDPVKPGRVYHNREFVEKCESLGLHPLPIVGAHSRVADGVFAHLMGELPCPAIPSGAPSNTRNRPKTRKGAKVFTKLIKEITVAARLGGGDQEGNPRLRAAILAAKAENMPKDNIERAIKKGTGELEGTNYEETNYEGYGPGGVAILVDILTDNRNRAASEVRFVFSKNGGSLGAAGCVAWMFSTRGTIVFNKDKVNEDDLMEVALEAGAEDVRDEGPV